VTTKVVKLASSILATDRESIASAIERLWAATRL
jgi:hypothetical protein